MPAFCCVLELPNGDSVDPMFFVTALDGWQVGDTFLGWLRARAVPDPGDRR